MASANSKAKEKKQQTVRERAQTESQKSRKPRRLQQGASRAKKPINRFVAFSKKEYYLPLPDNKLGKFLNKKRSIMPKYFVESWRELKEVTWPNRSMTTKLTISVIVFALGFSILIGVVDFILDKIFRQIFL